MVSFWRPTLRHSSTSYKAVETHNEQKHIYSVGNSGIQLGTMSNSTDIWLCPLALSVQQLSTFGSNQKWAVYWIPPSPSPPWCPSMTLTHQCRVVLVLVIWRSVQDTACPILQNQTWQRNEILCHLEAPLERLSKPSLSIIKDGLVVDKETLPSK